MTHVKQRVRVDSSLGWHTGSCSRQGNKHGNKTCQKAQVSKQCNSIATSVGVTWDKLDWHKYLHRRKRNHAVVL